MFGVGWGVFGGGGGGRGGEGEGEGGGGGVQGYIVRCTYKNYMQLEKGSYLHDACALACVSLLLGIFVAVFSRRLGLIQGRTHGPLVWYLVSGLGFRV